MTVTNSLKVGIMKNVILTAVIVASAAHTGMAQFNFKSALKTASNQIQRQVSSQVGREVHRQVTRHIQPTHTTYPHPRPQPKPCPQPVRPLPRPVTYPKPVHPVHRPVCVIKPAPPIVHPVRQPVCVIKPSPVQPAVPAPVQPAVELPKVSAGQQVTIDGRLFGPDTGVVVVQIGGLSLNAQVTGWSSSQVTAVLPQLPMAASARATIVIKTSYNHVADKLEVELLPASERNEVAPVAAAAPAANELPRVAVGQEVTLDAANIGAQQGQVQIELSGLTLNATVKTWSTTQTTAVLPTIGIQNPVKALVKILTANGQVVEQVEVMLTPGTDVASR